MHDNQLQSIVSQLKAINYQTGYKILLCPIGTASGHEDDIVLSRIYEKIPNISILINNPKIDDIIKYIAFSEIFLGTSLHGVITAMNYGVLYVGINQSVTKQIEYIKNIIK